MYRVQMDGNHWAPILLTGATTGKVDHALYSPYLPRTDLHFFELLKEQLADKR